MRKYKMRRRITGQPLIQINSNKERDLRFAEIDKNSRSMLIDGENIEILDLR